MHDGIHTGGVACMMDLCTIRSLAHKNCDQVTMGLQ